MQGVGREGACQHRVLRNRDARPAEAEEEEAERDRRGREPAVSHRAEPRDEQRLVRVEAGVRASVSGLRVGEGKSEG